MITIEWIKERILNNEYYYTRHADTERQNDDLSLKEIEEAVLGGHIIEHYPDTGRGESCLVAGFTRFGKPIHAVFGYRDKWPVIITVYIPRPPKFKSPYERST